MTLQAYVKDLVNGEYSPKPIKKNSPQPIEITITKISLNFIPENKK